MQFSSVKVVTGRGGEPRVEALARHIGRLLRHPAYSRKRVVSPMLLRHLPNDSGYAWRDEDALSGRLARAGLDAACLDHLIGNARDELARLRVPGGA